MFLQVVRYLGACGLHSCALLVSKGYPDIGWNPVEGERYLDFLRFAVFCNGEVTCNSNYSSVVMSMPTLMHIAGLLVGCL